MNVRGLLELLREQNIWQRSIGANKLLAILHEGGRMTAELFVGILVLGNLYSFSFGMVEQFIATSLGSFIATALTLAIAGYVLGVVYALFFWIFTSVLGRLRSPSLFIGSGICIATIFPLLAIGFDIHDFNPSIRVYMAYCLVLIFAGRFGAKVYDVSVTKKS